MASPVSLGSGRSPRASLPAQNHLPSQQNFQPTSSAHLTQLYQQPFQSGNFSARTSASSCPPIFAASFQGRSPPAVNCDAGGASNPQFRNHSQHQGVGGNGGGGGGLQAPCNTSREFTQHQRPVTLQPTSMASDGGFPLINVSPRMSTSASNFGGSQTQRQHQSVNTVREFISLDNSRVPFTSNSFNSSCGSNNPGIYVHNPGTSPSCSTSVYSHVNQQRSPVLVSSVGHNIRPNLSQSCGVLTPANGLVPMNASGFPQKDLHNNPMLGPAPKAANAYPVHEPREQQGGEACNVNSLKGVNTFGPRGQSNSVAQHQGSTNRPLHFMNRSSVNEMGGSCENIALQSELDFFDHKHSQMTHSLQDKGSDFPFNFDGTLNSTQQMCSESGDLDVAFQPFSPSSLDADPREGGGPQICLSDNFGQYSSSGQESYHVSSGLASNHPLHDQRPQSCPDIFANLKFEADLRASVSPHSVSSQQSLHMDFETVGSVATHSPFDEHSPGTMDNSTIQQQCLTLLDHDGTVPRAVNHSASDQDITPESAGNPFDYLNNSSDLDELAQSIVESYHQSSTIDVPTESPCEFSTNNIPKFNYNESNQQPQQQRENLQNTGSSTSQGYSPNSRHHRPHSHGAPHPYSKEDHLTKFRQNSGSASAGPTNMFPSAQEMSTFTKPQPVSPCANIYGSGHYGQTHPSASPCNQVSASMVQIPKQEPVFTPPASPFETNSFVNYGCSPQPGMSGSRVTTSSPQQNGRVVFKRQHSAPLPPHARMTQNVSGLNNYSVTEQIQLTDCSANDIDKSCLLPPASYQPTNGFCVSQSMKRNSEQCRVKSENSTLDYQQGSAGSSKFLLDSPGASFGEINNTLEIRFDSSEVNPDIQMMINEETALNNVNKNIYLAAATPSKKQLVTVRSENITDRSSPTMRGCRPKRGSTRGRKAHGRAARGIRVRTDVQQTEEVYEVSSISSNTGKSETKENSTKKNIVPVMRIRRKSSVSESSLNSLTERATHTNPSPNGVRKSGRMENSHSIGRGASAKENSNIENIGGGLSTVDVSSIADPTPGFGTDETGILSTSAGSLRGARDTSRGPRGSPAGAGSSGAKICGVCGDVAKSMHFGGMACDSCKAFFRRSVQGRSWTDFKCNAEQKCNISKKNRKNCQYCRFTKCRSNGMEVTWVMTEAERMALWKTRLSKHRKNSTSTASNCGSASGAGRTPRSKSISESSNGTQDPDDLDCDGSSLNDYSSDSGSHSSSHREGGREVRPGSSSQVTARARKRSVSSIVEEDEEEEGGSSYGASRSIGEVADVLESIDATKEVDPAPGGVMGCSVNTFLPEYSLDAEDLMAINNLIALQDAVFLSNPYPNHCFGATVEALANIFVCICKKMGTFFYRVDDFHLICKEDQTTLLRAGIAMSIYLHGAYAYDIEKKTWPRSQCKDSLRVPPMTSETLLNFTGMPDAFKMVTDFYITYGPDLYDEGVLVMLSLVAIFQVTGCHDQIIDKKTICDLREKYIQLLGRYLKFRQGPRGTNVTLPKILLGLEVTRKIAEFHTKVDIKPTIPASEMALSSSTTSFTNQMVAIRDVMKQSMSGSLSEYSSVFGNSKRGESSSGSVKSFAGGESPKLRLHYHHPLTNVIFGPQSRTDVLFSNALDDITRYKEKLLSISYEPDSFQQYRNPGSVFSSGSSDVCALSVCSDNAGAGCSKIEEIEASAIEDVEELDGKEEEEQGPSRAASSKALVSVKNVEATCSPRPSSATSSGKGAQPKSSHNSVNKQKGIKVLCEMLEYISKCDDPEAIASLQKSLPAHVLKNLASKLNVQEIP